MSEPKNVSRARFRIGLGVQEDKRTLYNAVRTNSRFDEQWKSTVLEDWMPFDENDPDSTGACNFEPTSMSEFRELIKTLDTNKINDWHLWIEIKTDSIHCDAGLGFRSDDDMAASVHIDWAKLNGKTHMKVKDAINILEDIVEARRSK